MVKDPQLGAITKVDTRLGGQIHEITNIDGMTSEIQRVTEQRFALAESAPVTSSSLQG